MQQLPVQRKRPLCCLMIRGGGCHFAPFLSFLFERASCFAVTDQRRVMDPLRFISLGSYSALIARSSHICHANPSVAAFPNTYTDDDLLFSDQNLPFCFTNSFQVPFSFSVASPPTGLERDSSAREYSTVCVSRFQPELAGSCAAKMQDITASAPHMCFPLLQRSHITGNPNQTKREQRTNPKDSGYPGMNERGRERGGRRGGGWRQSPTH